MTTGDGKPGLLVGERGVANPCHQTQANPVVEWRNVSRVRLGRRRGIWWWLFGGDLRLTLQGANFCVGVREKSLRPPRVGARPDLRSIREPIQSHWTLSWDGLHQPFLRLLVLDHHTECPQYQRLTY